MLYCEKCMLLCESGKCPVCSQKLFGAQKLREVKDNDPVLLTKQDRIAAGLLEPVLRDNNIPYLKEGNLGAGLTAELGDMMEEYRFYIPYGKLEEGRDIVESLFGNSSDDPDDDEEDEDDDKNDG